MTDSDAAMSDLLHIWQHWRQFCHLYFQVGIRGMYNGHQGEKSMLLESWKCPVDKNGKKLLGQLE